MIIGFTCKNILNFIEQVINVLGTYKTLLKINSSEKDIRLDQSLKVTSCYYYNITNENKDDSKTDITVHLAAKHQGVGVVRCFACCSYEAIGQFCL